MCPFLASKVSFSAHTHRNNRNATLVLGVVRLFFCHIVSMSIIHVHILFWIIRDGKKFGEVSFENLIWTTFNFVVEVMFDFSYSSSWALAKLSGFL